MKYSKIIWDRETVEEWLGIAVLVDRCMPPVYHKGISGQRLEIQRSWTELLWDIDEIKNRTPKWQPTSQQVAMWVEVILRWLPLLENTKDRKILWLRVCGAQWTRIARIVGLHRHTIPRHYDQAIDFLVRNVKSLYPEIS